MSQSIVSIQIPEKFQEVFKVNRHIGHKVQQTKYSSQKSSWYDGLSWLSTDVANNPSIK